MNESELNTDVSEFNDDKGRSTRKYLPITEIFLSIQGEGSLIGTPMVFVRLWGCNMACTWCDTRYSWAPEYHGKTRIHKYTSSELAGHLLANHSNVSWFNFTGGEPLLHWKGLLPVVVQLKEHDKLTCIQTNGKLFPHSLDILDKICMDIKCPSSGEQSNTKFISKLRPQDDVKFVVASEKDWSYMEHVLNTNPTKAHIIIQPVLWENEDLSSYFARLRWMVQKLKRSPLLQKEKIRILPQFHQLLWRDVPGT